MRVATIGRRCSGPRLRNLRQPQRISLSFSRTHFSEGKMSVLVSVLITFLVVILILYLVQRLPIDGRVRQIIQLVVIVIGIISLLRYLAVF
jgi:hypothetical protein